MGRGKKHTLPSVMYNGDVPLFTNTQKAEHFNQYFAGIATKICANIPNTQNSFQAYLKPTKGSNSLFLRPTTAAEIITLALSLKSSKSCGSDDIAPRVVKECIYIIAEPLCDVFNKSLSQGVVPDKL